MMGREGALNTALQEVGLIKEPLDILLFSDFAVTVAMLQLYILFMVAPIFMLAQIDRSSLEAARDLGANAFKTFREVVLPQSAPGIVIGSIFVFILTMGEFATVRIIGAGPSPRSGRSSRPGRVRAVPAGRGQRGLPRPRDDPRRLRPAAVLQPREDL